MVKTQDRLLYRFVLCYLQDFFPTRIYFQQLQANIYRSNIAKVSLATALKVPGGCNYPLK